MHKFALGCLPWLQTQSAVVGRPNHVKGCHGRQPRRTSPSIPRVLLPRNPKLSWPYPLDSGGHPQGARGGRPQLPRQPEGLAQNYHTGCTAGSGAAPGSSNATCGLPLRALVRAAASRTSHLSARRLSAGSRSHSHGSISGPSPEGWPAKPASQDGTPPNRQGEPLLLSALLADHTLHSRGTRLCRVDGAGVDGAAPRHAEPPPATRPG